MAQRTPIREIVHCRYSVTAKPPRIHGLKYSRRVKLYCPRIQKPLRSYRNRLRNQLPHRPMFCLALVVLTAVSGRAESPY